MNTKLRCLFLVMFLSGMAAHAEGVRVHMTVSGNANFVEIMTNKMFQIEGVEFVTTNAAYEVGVVIASVEGGYMASMAVAKAAPQTELIGPWMATGTTDDAEKGCERFAVLFRNCMFEPKSKVKGPRKL